ncbi:MAG: hypothetical protein HRJ53_21810 [Acidobacteria bacterium Pan2503]|uniref:Formimidoylglutamase n=1 Tax=Candidatus Acidiferrum panamense TaxID=2741543 RepID=A0A7V8SYR7_9BACT|nr:hypothetical protein [Candidatus Acidoferrum panamensis]
MRQALLEFAKHKNLLGLDIAQFNPDKDPDHGGAKKLVDLLAEILAARLQASEAPSTEASGATEVSSSGSTA